MTFPATLSAGVNKILVRAGTQIKVEYYTVGFGSVYDDVDTLTLSGTTWTSGIILPVNTRRGSEDSVLVEQGKLQEKDKKLYVNGSLIFTDEDFVVKVQIGSPTGDIYSTIPLGGIQYEALSQPVYKKQYIRLIQLGSF